MNLDCSYLITTVPSTTSTHFLRTLGIPFQFVDEPSEATEHGESRTGTGFDVEGVEDFLSCNSGIVPSTERITELNDRFNKFGQRKFRSFCGRINLSLHQSGRLVFFTFDFMKLTLDFFRFIT